MKIVLISYVMPTPDNFGAGSAHPYHLLKYRPKGIDVVLYTYNTNHVSACDINGLSKELELSGVKFLRTPWFFPILFKLKIGFFKNLLPFPFGYYYDIPKSVVREIEKLHPDGVWIWGDFLPNVAKKFQRYKRVMTLPDSVALYYHRLMGDNFLFGSWFKMLANCDQYVKNIKMEKSYPVDDNICFHLVGAADRDFLKRINPRVKAVFIRHPHYNYKEDRIIKFSEPKIKILIAGKYNLYMKTAFDELLPVLCSHSELAEHYSITFLGKGWDFAVDKLRAEGYESQQVGFVDVYLDEIIKYDIQLTPISVGTGTKGKVLDALSNGLLVIGTPYAMENVAVEDGVSCIEYRSPGRVVEVLADMPHRLSLYEQMAENGRRAVLSEHNREHVSKQFFDLFL